MDEAYAEWVLRPTLPADQTEPYLAWFLCGVQRSGTWLLAGLLDSTGIAGLPHEWFSQATETANRRLWKLSPADDYVACVKRAGSTPNGVFGSKLTWDAVERAGDLAAFAPEQRFVWVRRSAEAIGISRHFREQHVRADGSGERVSVSACLQRRGQLTGVGS